jgi:hypothetical protein
MGRVFAPLSDCPDNFLRHDQSLAKTQLSTQTSPFRTVMSLMSWWHTPAKMLLLASLLVPLHAREKNALEYGAGLVVNVPMPESDVAKAVEEVSQNGIIRGTKEYSRDEYVQGATPATSSRLFPAWTEGGKVFYKVRTHCLDPLNFKNGGDMGTLAVRYIVQRQDDKNTVLRIDAIFVEDFRRASHASNGSVEGSEYKDIHDHLEAMQAMRQQTTEDEKEKQEQAIRKQRLSAPSETTPANGESSTKALETSVQNSTPVDDAQPASESLEEHVKKLRRQVERLVRAPGAPLKSAPFHTASTLQSLPQGTEVMIVISTPYWFGVETHDGKHGWIPRDQLELLP